MRNLVSSGPEMQGKPLLGTSGGGLVGQEFDHCQDRKARRTLNKASPTGDLDKARVFWKIFESTHLGVRLFPADIMVYPNATFHNATSANDTTPNVVFIWRPVTAVNLSGFLLNSFLLFLLIYDSRLNHSLLTCQRNKLKPVQKPFPYQVSRMWAIIHPVSYRNLLTNRFTICLCVCAWAFPHAVFLPFWALNTLKHRSSVKQNVYHCYVNCGAVLGSSFRNRAQL
ncbi:hypothetical protein BV898_13301 [Hypsibius exemplaris]|uniref:Uncharacterized protein n=1 Tax=Hypsibius exemplaris TaxID=2072580 RepID=A0A1W0WB29_HYPEX|nr:hypothetical protein BV898_13301 [Hypsibius exemplaris]